MRGRSWSKKGVIRPVINIGCQAIFKLVFAIASLKVVAFYVGPSGMAVVAQLQAFLQILSAAVSSVTSSGVVKLVAEKKHSKEQVLLSSLFLLFVLSLIFVVAMVAASRLLSDFFLQGDWIEVLLLLPVGAFFIGMNNLLVSYFNGMQMYNEYFWYSVVTAFILALSTCLISFWFGHTGAIYSIALSPVIAGICMLLPKKVRLPGLSWSAVNVGIMKTLMSYSVMALGSVAVVYGVQIALRDYISTNSSTAEAGVWYAATRLSDIYMGICSVLFSTLLLPRYSAVEDEKLTGMVWRIGGATLVFAVVMALSVNLLSGLGIRLIYGQDFALASEILKLYVIGDALKCMSWVFLYVILARQYVKIYLCYEVFAAVLYLMLCIFCYRRYGFENMAYGYPMQGAVSLSLLLVWFSISRHNTTSIESKANDVL